MRFYYLALMLNICFFVILTGFDLFGQTQVFKTPVEYNDYIIGEQQKIGQKLQEFSASISTKSKSKMNQALEDVRKQINESLEKLKAIADYEGNWEFRNAAIILFEFYGVISNNQYQELIEIVVKEKYSNVDQERIKYLLENVSKQEATHDKRFMEAQQEFAKQFNVKIRETE